MEGIVLSILPYGERDRILTLFTQQGLLKVFVKISQRPNLTRVALTTPFTRGEYLLRIGKSTLYRLIDGSPIDQHLGLRCSLKRLETAQKMVRSLLATQWPDKPSPALYALFSAFLKKVSESDAPLLAPFLIKLLKHEGEMDVSDLPNVEQQLILEIAEARSFESFPSLPDALEDTLYSKVMGASATSI